MFTWSSGSSFKRLLVKKSSGLHHRLLELPCKVTVGYLGVGWHRCSNRRGDVDHRQTPADGKHGAMLLRIRAGALCGKRYCFRPCILKLGFASATHAAYVKDKRKLFRVMF